MRTSVLMLSGLVCAALTLGAGVQQPKDPQPNPHANPHAPAGQPAKPAGPEKKPEAKPLPAARPEDVKTIDAIIKTFYEVTAGPAGKARDWDRMRSLFVEDAKMIPLRHDPHAGASDLMMIPVERYIEMNKNYFERGGFLETEAARRTEQFGSIAQVWSTFESRRAKEDPAPYARGVYSIQLAFNGERWWIVNVMWDSEQGETKLPDKYLKSPTAE